jgi:hypothetical protein
VLMSPVADLAPVAAAGREVGNAYRALLNDPQAAEGATAILYLGGSLAVYVGHFGVFDYQRQGSYLTGSTSIPWFRDVSTNIALKGGRQIQSIRNGFIRVAIIAAYLVAPLAAIYLMLAFLDLAPTPWTCLTEKRASIVDLSGYDFSIRETNCDAIGKSDWMSVYISHTGKSEHALIFEYDPMEQNPIPILSFDPEGNFLITIASVATVLHEEHEWRGRKITYKIGKEYYPAPEQWPGER